MEVKFKVLKDYFKQIYQNDDSDVLIFSEGEIVNGKLIVRGEFNVEIQSNEVDWYKHDSNTNYVAFKDYFEKI